MDVYIPQQENQWIIGQRSNRWCWSAWTPYVQPFMTDMLFEGLCFVSVVFSWKCQWSRFSLTSVLHYVTVSYPSADTHAPKVHFQPRDTILKMTEPTPLRLIFLAPKKTKPENEKWFCLFLKERLAETCCTIATLIHPRWMGGLMEFCIPGQKVRSAGRWTSCVFRARVNLRFYSFSAGATEIALPLRRRTSEGVN